MHRGATAQIHVRLWTCSDNIEALDGALSHARRPFTTLTREAAAAFQLIQTHPPHIVPGARVLASTIAEADDQCGHRPLSSAGPQRTAGRVPPGWGAIAV